MQLIMMSEKQSLRKSEFPNCAREALHKVEQLCVPQASGRPPSAKEMDLAMEIMAEFIFCEVDRRGHSKKLTCIQQLQLAQLLCDYFAGVQFGGSGPLGAIAGPNGDTARNTIFLSLFPPTTSKGRAQALVQLVSMAISTKNKPVLDSTGIWMQQLGCTSKLVLQLAEGLVKDYFVLVPKAVTRLQDLPALAPHFTANFLTTVAETYASSEQKDGFSPPPAALLEVITQWVSDNPRLCLAALIVNLQPLLPLGSIPMAALTPFAGLFKWCVLSPLLTLSVSNKKSRDITNGSSNGITSTKNVKTEGMNNQDGECSGKESPLYSQLHLALLESLVENVYSSANRVNSVRDVVSVQHIAGIVEPVHTWYNTQLKISERKPPELSRAGHEALELALDRLGQAVQVALAANCAYGNKQYLLTQLDTLKNLPGSRLLRIVLKTHQTPSLF
ncbi:hypothetical protein KUF71_024300 [Frankliniella fusca]|uniref:Uncharacterized protein n=1 Tax=Frankliniella fusca TaxID=407009 RepID=A0AAE1H6S2_9NEOP|nr:hypothetical protein KUF71_024300 [Frankliniella fusca]